MPGSTSTEKTITVGLILPTLPRSEVEEHLEELARLVEAAGGVVGGRLLQERSSPDSATYIGKGKAEELERLVKSSGARTVVFDDDLSPAQVRNLEKIVEVKIVDRSGLILDIFATRARSRESQTQVELAQLNYLLPRLTRQWSHLSRQAGGIGTRGVGETQLEIDKRIIRQRISRLKTELKHIERVRETQRKGRRNVFTVALTGYTNAGKSTLFNRLTHGDAEAADKLFATLDARAQKFATSMPRETIAIDTVGFIRKLPHHLVASFRSTMEEAVSADLVLHVIDASHEAFEEQRRIGIEVLGALGVVPTRVIEVYNKKDRRESDSSSVNGDGVATSALNGDGIELLVERIRERELAGGATVSLTIPHSESKWIAHLHEVATILEKEVTDSGVNMVAWISPEELRPFETFITRTTLPGESQKRLAS